MTASRVILSFLFFLVLSSFLHAQSESRPATRRSFDSRLSLAVRTVGGVLLGHTPREGGVTVTPGIELFVRPSVSAPWPHSESPTAIRELCTDNFVIQLANDLRRYDVAGLSLAGCSDVTDLGLEAVCGVPSLKFLDLSRGGFLPPAKYSPSGLAGLTRLTKLKRLNLGWCPGVDVSDLTFAARLVNLEDLDLSHTNTSDGAVHNLAFLPNLRRLDLQRTPVTGTCFGEGAFQALQYLDLSFTRVDDSALARLRHLKSLRDLDVGGCAELTEEGLVELARLPDLKLLWLRPKLGTLSSDPTSPLTDEAVARLRSKLPRATIIWTEAERAKQTGH